MRITKKKLMTASLLLASMTAIAQSPLLEQLPEMLQNDFGIEPKKSINQERDVLQEGRPLKSRCEIYTFTLKGKQQEKVLQRLLDAFEVAGRNENCYSVNSMNELTGKESLRNLIIGDDLDRYVTIGQDYENYINANFIDEMDTAKTHRYAYALEWRKQTATSEKGSLDLRYTITYARIPTANTTTVKFSSLADDVREMIKNGRVLMGSDFTADDLLCDDNILLLFSKLKDQYINGSNREFSAISIYLLCKRARSYGFFQGEEAKATLGQLKDEVRELVNTGSSDKAVLYYLWAALQELEQIK